MKRTILASFIVPPPVTYFADPPAGGEGSAAGGDNSGGSGNPGDADIMAFDAPDLDASLKSLEDGSPPPEPRVTPPPKTDSPKTDPPKTEPKPPAGGEPPVKQLRDELTATKIELADLKKKYEAGDPRITEAEGKVVAAQKELDGYKSKITDYERKLALADPAVTKELADFDDAYNKDARKFESRVPELPIPTVNALVKKFHALPRGKEGYKEALGEFEAEVNAALGGVDGAEHRKLNAALDFIERTHQFAAERPAIEKKIHDSALSLQTEAQGKEFSSAREFVTSNLEKARGIPEGLETRDPFHPKVMLSAFEKSLPPEQLASYQKGLPEFVELVMAGPKPFNEADYAGQTPEAIAAAREAQTQRYQQARGNAVDVLYNGLRALRLMPTLVKDWQRLKGKVKESVDGLPPDPTKTGDNQNQGGGDDVGKFEAPAIPDSF